MQTNLAKHFQQDPAAEAIEGILRKCVHCGFCNATCPTYQLRGDELDGPRGRIYQMKQYFEGREATAELQLHLDRCLTCRSCETTCPSGVHYSHLLEIAREKLEVELPRSVWQRIQLWTIVRLFNSGWLFKILVICGQAFAPMLPKKISSSIPAKQVPPEQSTVQHSRRVLMLSGCVQPTITPNTNAMATGLLDKLGITAIEIKDRHCCGAVGLHTSQTEQGKQQVRRLIDLWWPYVESGIEAIVVTASGCGVTVQDYGELLKSESAFAARARKISELACDISELIGRELDHSLPEIESPKRVAFHTPCTLQHGLGLKGRVEPILEKAGYQLCRVDEAHLCCGSAGTYSILQPELSGQLQNNKQKALMVDVPDVIATANIGCQLHIGNGSTVPVVHWIELVYAALAGNNSNQEKVSQ
ncbi:MAG: glycolate oxidase subunit GlcF [Gammaproteobacteria bacterium]|nr:glycolate oxidase subunit GlcF [Gammaproteobacteria bacterium]